MKATIAVLLGMFCLPLLVAQTQNQPSPAQSQSAPPSASTSKPKAKHVWTNDDIQSIRGGVSLMGGDKEKAGGDSASRQRTAGENCELDPWMAGLMIVLKAQGVPINRHYWQNKLFGGVCKDASRLEDLSAADGVNSFDDGTNFTVQTQVSETWPQGAAMVAAAKKDHPFLVSYQHQPYVAIRVNYVDHRYSDGGHIYVVSKVTMKHPITGDVVVYDAGDPDALHIDGTLVATVSR